MHSFDPASLHDPVALKTEWGPCVRGGASSRTRFLLLDGERAVFTTTTLTRLASLPWLLVAAVSVVLPFFISPDADPLGRWLVPGILFTVFAGVGVVFLCFTFRPVVIDRGARLLWKGYGERAAGQPGVTSLRKLHALQIITEHCVSHDSKGRSHASFTSYELNLVFADGRRANVIDHGDLGAVQADGATLARFLQVPLWDPDP
jgi:hypothetical protein